MAKLDRKSGKEVADSIIRKIIVEVTNSIKNSSFDRTKSGRVVAIKGGNFDVSIENALYKNVFALRNIGKINVGDVVFCNIPNNQVNRVYIIGVVDGSLLQYLYTDNITQSVGNNSNLVMSQNASTKSFMPASVVLYDKDSSDSSINWGYVNGIQGGTTVTGKDFSPYRALRLTVIWYAASCICELSLEKRIGQGTYYSCGATAVTTDEKEFLATAQITVNTAKTQISMPSIGFHNASYVYNERNADDDYYIAKIDGMF